MLVKVKTILDAPLKRVRYEIQKPAVMQYVSWPLQYFVPTKHPFPTLWQNGEYEVELRLFNLLIIGKQLLQIELPTQQNHRYAIRDHGHGISGVLKFVKKWDHRIILAENENKTTLYSDIIEVNAGIITIPVSLYAQLFYRWRQKRWKKFLSSTKV